MKGTIRYTEEKGFYVEHTPKTIYGYYGGKTISKTFYQELILDPFTENSIYKDGDEINFKKELYIDNGGSFHYAEVVPCLSKI
jgi:hypothetical protein